jgi:HAE1 family hydrophobic/amphiphilic exporter-1
MIALYQAPGTNAVDLASQVIAAMDELKGGFPEGVDYDSGTGFHPAHYRRDQGDRHYPADRLGAGDPGGFCLHPGLAGHPHSHHRHSGFPAGAFAIFPLLGFTINVLSLLGLVLAIGIVVDDAIVVVEAVQVNLQKGMNSKEATIHAMKEVTAPVIATTLVLVAVFIPVASWEGSPAGCISSLPLRLRSRWYFPR